MKGTRVANRYAKSLLRLSLENGELETAHKDMQMVAELCDTSKELDVFLKSPIVKTDKKLSVLEEIFGSSISKLSMSFIKVITTKRREIYLHDIAKEFVKQYRDHKKILTAVIKSAVGLDDKLKEQVLNIVKKTEGQEVELVEVVDSSLIGGFVLTIGDKQVDASIVRKLQQLTMTFNENPYIKEY